MRNRVGEETEDETRPKRIDNERDRSIDQSTRDHRLPLSKRASLEKLGLLFTRILGGFSACLPISTIVYTRRGAAIDTIQENGNNIASILSRRRVSLSLSSLSFARSKLLLSVDCPRKNSDVQCQPSSALWNFFFLFWRSLSSLFRYVSLLLRFSLRTKFSFSSSVSHDQADDVRDAYQ